PRSWTLLIALAAFSPMGSGTGRWVGPAGGRYPQQGRCADGREGRHPEPERVASRHVEDVPGRPHAHGAAEGVGGMQDAEDAGEAGAAEEVARHGRGE